jgi:2-polyprenyl-3-methyl-5-hydroxy-6-metoxy-1,4-benzoquinol methylase
MDIWKTERTAVTRKGPSAPCRMLYKSSRLTEGKVLDYGCGRGEDAYWLRGRGEDMEVLQWDPFHSPIMPRGKFDVILCTYVINVMPKTEERRVLDDIKSRLRKGGVAYITVRRDVEKDGYTSKGTYQRNVVLKLPSIYNRGKFETYELRGDT